MKPWLERELSPRVSLLVEPRDLWFGVYWDRRPGLVIYVGVPLLVLRFDLSPVRCTGVFAKWCPRCGNCRCPLLREAGDPCERTMDDPACPLHAPHSRHGEDCDE